MSITIRTMIADDIEVVAPLIARAFNTVNARYGYPSEFPEPQVAALLSHFYLREDPEGCLVALRDGAVCGSIFARRRGGTVTVGPVSVDPGCQGLGVGRRMMQAVVDLYPDAASYRLVQAAFNKESYSLYSRTGYVAVEPLLRLERPANQAPPDGDEPHVRRAAAEEAAAVADLDRRLTGVERERELATIFAMGSVYVLEDGGGLRGYLAMFPAPGQVYLGPAVAGSEDEISALVRAALHAAGSRPVTAHLPTRFAATIDECYRLGFRLFSLEMFMVRGEWNMDEAAYLRSTFPETH